jgi:hypothetical protein
MQLKRSLQPRTRHVHSVTVEDAIWAALLEHCMRHNQNPGEVVEAALKRQIDKDLSESFG